MSHFDKELLLGDKYLAVENEIPRKKIEGWIKLSQCERMLLSYPTNPSSNLIRLSARLKYLNRFRIIVSRLEVIETYETSCMSVVLTTVKMSVDWV